MKAVLVYRSAANLAEKAPLHFPAHKAYYETFVAAGTLTMIGAYADRSGALSVFTTRAAAEAFVQEDPFVVNGVVESWEIHDWNEVIGG
ncbi:MAG TPA: YciI family protein [Conexibacter sp.]|jgi:hypothetical protein